jgi:hypothetical protein
MSVKAYGYVQDCGDGSYSICWFKVRLEDYVEDDYLEYFSDSDGLNARSVLTFESYEAAETVGIRFLNEADYVV